MYDGDSRRIQVIEDGVTTTYIYSGLEILHEENTTGTANYIYGLTGKLAKRTTINQETNTFYYHTDHLGSTRLVTHRYSYCLNSPLKYTDPFGLVTYCRIYRGEAETCVTPTKKGWIVTFTHKDQTW